MVGQRVLTIRSLQDVKDALNFIAAQGEASSENPTDSHFERFLNIYREFPEPDAPGWNLPPTYPVIWNPTTTLDSIQFEITQLWARLFDIRYRMLLVSLAHVTTLPVQDGDATTTNKKRALISSIFSSFMRQRLGLSLSKLAIALAQMPAHETGGASTAGAPFGMPYSLAIPDQEPEQWQYHLDLITSSNALVAVLKTKVSDMAADPRFAFFGDAGAKLDQLLTADSTRQATIMDIINHL